MPMSVGSISTFFRHLLPSDVREETFKFYNGSSPFKNNQTTVMCSFFHKSSLKDTCRLFSQKGYILWSVKKKVLKKYSIRTAESS